MKQAQIKRSIETGELQLTRSQHRTHFFTAYFTLFVGLLLPVFLIWDYIFDKTIDSPLSIPFEVLPFTLLWLLLSLVSYVFQKRGLKLVCIETKHNLDELRELILHTARREKWTVKNNTKKFVILKTHPGFTWNWGEQITILFDINRVWLNSICDPTADPAIYSLGRNRRNVEILTGQLSGNRRVASAKNT